MTTEKEIHMKLSFAVLAFVLSCLAAHADSMADTYVTTDTMSAAVDAGAGQSWDCSDLEFFSCTTTDDSFTCYGWGNCAALDAIPVVSDVAALPPPPVATPEPGSLVLLGTGLTALLFWRRR
jgi:PEP-CTERM motif